jgi:hypothetical protein
VSGFGGYTEEERDALLPPPLLPGDELTGFLLCHVGSGCKPVGCATRLQVSGCDASIVGGGSGVIYVSPDGTRIIPQVADVHMPKGWTSYNLRTARGTDPRAARRAYNERRLG